MSKVRPVFSGKVIAGKVQLETSEREKMELFVESLPDGDVCLEVYERKYQRSNQANDYYFGVVVELIAESLGWDKETAHDFLKTRYNSVLVNWKGKEVWITRSTASLNTAEFSQYVDRCIQFASENQIIIPSAEKISL